MKRFICILLVLIFAFTFMVACDNSEGNDTSNVAGGAVNDEYIDADGNYVPRLEVQDWGGREFSIIVRGEAYGTYQSDDFTTESELYGELIEDAVQRRNDTVERLYNVKIAVEKTDDVLGKVRLACSSSLPTYDAVMPSLSELATLATEGYLWDLTELKNFDQNAPWYDQNCSEAFAIQDQIFFTTGDITILNKVNTPHVLFNKEMAAKYFPEEDFYQLVRDKKWTFDKLVESAKSVASITTPDGTYSDDNIYGMVTAHGDPGAFYGASGELICGKDEDNLPYLMIGTTERSVTLAKKILDTFNGADWLIYAQDCAAPIWETSFAIFYEGRSLFRPGVFSATTKLRKLSQIEFGVLPTPLMDSTQNEYFAYCSTGATAGIAIPTSAAEPEFSAYMVEACSAWAKNYLTTAYYEVNLRYKDLRDDESEEMLDIIFGNIVYDIGECYNFGGYAGMFSEMAKAGSSDVASEIESRKSEAEAKINELIDTYSYNS